MQKLDVEKALSSENETLRKVGKEVGRETGYEKENEMCYRDYPDYF